MKTLLLFSLKRRFKHKMSVFLLLFYWIIMAVLFNLDGISSTLHLTWGQNKEIVVDEKTRSWIVDESMWEQQGFVFTNMEGDFGFEKTEEGIRVFGNVDGITQTKLQALLLKNHQLRLLSKSPESVQTWMDDYTNLNIQYENQSVGSEEIRQNVILYILTSLYFLVLNFIAVNSNEIIMEKTSNILALVLSSVSVEAHFVSKLLSALITVSIQLLNSILSVVVVGWLRYHYDHGSGLILWLQKVLNLPLGINRFEDILVLMNVGYKDILGLFISIVCVLLGVLIVQVLILVLSSRARTSEEAGGIQAPFYLILLLLYYGSLSFNTADQLNQGLPYILSFIPVSSMLVMPMRIIQGSALTSEILLSFGISFSVLFLIILSLFPLYRNGLERT